MVMLMRARVHMEHGIIPVNMGPLRISLFIFLGTGVIFIGLYPYGNAHESQGPDGNWNYTCQHEVLENNNIYISRDWCIIYRPISLW